MRSALRTASQQLRQRIGRIAGDHAAPRHAAQPGQLPLGELAGGEDAPVAQVRRAGTAQPVASARPAVPRPAGSRRSACWAGRRCRSPRARSAFTSSRKPAASMASKRCAMRSCSQPRSAGSSENSGVELPRGRSRCRSCRAWKLDQGRPDTPEHFQRALDALRVAGRQPRRRDRVDARQFGVQRGPALLAPPRASSCGAHGRRRPAASRPAPRTRP